MRSNKVLGVAFAALALMGLVACQQPNTTTVTSSSSSTGGTYTVLGQLSGTIVDDLGQPIKGVSISYNAPELSVSRAVTTVTSDANGAFTIANLQSGTYLVTLTPATTTTTTTSGTTTSVANLAAKVTVYIPSLKAYAAATGQTETLTANQTVVLSRTFTLPRISTASIKGTLVTQSGTTSFATQVPVATKSVVLDLTANPAVISGQATALADTSTASTKYTYAYPTYSATTSAITTSDFLTATTDATGTFTFAALPQLDFSSQPLYVEASTLATSSILSGSLPAGLYLAKYNFNDSKTIDLTAYPIVLTASSNWSDLKLVSASVYDRYGNNGNVATKAAAITLTFNNALEAAIPSTNYLTDNTGTLVLANLYLNGGSYGYGANTKFNATVAVSGKTLTITPAADLLPNTTYNIGYSITDGRTKVASSPLTGSFSFTTVAAATTQLIQIGNSTVNSYGYNQGVSVSAPIVLTFNEALATGLPASPQLDSANNPVLAYLWDNTTSKPVAATVVASASTLTITPSASLIAGDSYAVYYKVYSTSALNTVMGTYSNPLSGNFTFTTAGVVTPTAIIDLALDGTNNGGSTKYNSGASSFYLSFTKNNTYTSSSYQYSLTNLDGTITAWTDGTGTLTYSGDKVYLTLATGTTLKSGATMSLRVKQVNNNTVAYSNVVTVTDTVAPSSVVVTGAASTSIGATPGTIVSANYLGGSWNNSASTSDVIRNFTISLASNEEMTAPVVSLLTAVSSVTFTVELNSATSPASAKVYARIPAGVNLTATGATPNSLVISVKDAAGNKFTPAGTTTSTDITLAIQ